MMAKGRRVQDIEADDPGKSTYLKPKAEVIVEQKISRIWGYVREHCHSLESSRHDRFIRNIVYSLCGELAKRADAADAAAAATKADARDAKRRMAKDLELMQAMTCGNDVY